MVAVIFDMDGVLIDSNPTHVSVWVEYLSHLNLPSEGIDTWMSGKRNDQIMRILLGPDAPEDVIFAHGAAKEALYRERMRPRLEQCLMPGLRDFLASLDGLPIGLGTNAEPANVDFLLNEAAGLSSREARATLYRQALAILAHDVPSMVMFDELSTQASAANLRGLLSRLDQRDGLEFAWLAR